VSTLEVRDLWVKYYTFSGIVSAVSGVSFNLRKGEMLAVVGESGSGKSTLGLALLNMVPKPGKIVKGEVLLGGVNILKLTPEEIRKIRGSRLSMVFQDPFTTLDPLRKIVDQFEEFLLEHGFDKSKARRYCQRIPRSSWFTRENNVLLPPPIKWRPEAKGFNSDGYCSKPRSHHCR
jgi:peptide/nickel transport system ATP-binding protein